MSSDVGPVALPPNQPPQFYRGGAAITALRGTTDERHGHGPEDWVGSTTTLFGEDTAGLSRLPDGRWLRDAVGADPEGWLGAEHTSAFGDSTALLVKLLDAGQRLPVHFHPSDAFARRHFDSHFGKSEAWIVIGTTGADPRVHVGFTEPHSAKEINDWVRDQDAPEMLHALNSVAVRPGDTVYVPAGLPHAIGAGVFVVELQQPTDFSLTLEWRDFLAEPEKGHLGLGFETAIEALDTSGWDETRLATLIRRTGDENAAAVRLLADGADRYFRAERLCPSPALVLEPSFAVLVVLDGSGLLRTEHGSTLEIGRGDTLVLPHRAGQVELAGGLTAIRCRPPLPGKETQNV
ncbi:class I mannose-6-phosphate isomerase [Actinophytocola gossypii]|uniref:Class I mannose-6-phosphate isomerase n=1 Tax=Actinophytocola gossypii TaxID=2812003 RepID=A0ABT2JAE3_9PSEU|nr:class I mannose-6-phosphate isomerase [Actinophytocola gossypii]MCT2584835.1 class I mannose-6-phosphate isomerase [Actinophytocola gossypii]